MKDITKDRLLLLLIYLITFATAFFIGNSYSGTHVLLMTFMMVLAATIVLWLFSFLTNNSSIFDPYWSVAPPLTIIFLWWEVPGFTELAAAPWFYLSRNLLVFLLVVIYSIRLTGNFARGWKGLKHEDWRYIEIRKKTGLFYWAASFLGIHFFPALMVFMGCLSLWVVVIRANLPNILDLVGLLVTGFAILLEATADRQLRKFLLENEGKEITMNKGLWGIIRHPNYLGEMGFWWGLYFFALASDPKFWWVIAGPLAITLMFVFISVPMMEKRMKERRKDYESYSGRVPRLLPFRLKKSL